MRSPVQPAGLFVWFFGALFGAGACTFVAGLDGEFGLRAADGGMGGFDGMGSPDAAGGEGGMCVTGGCAIFCEDGGSCDDNNVCTEDACDIETGLCVNDGSKLQGMLVNDASPGDCEEIRCDNGQVVKVADDDEVPPQDNNDCDIEVCLDGMVVHQNDPLDTPCGTNGTLLCDGAGVCVNCINATQCNAADCENPICINSVCGVKDKPAGTACAGGNVCKGEGSCVECIADAQCSLAASEVCDTGTNICVLSCPDMTKNGMETDVDCGGGACSKCANGKVCTINADCISNKCNNGSMLCVP